jgi:transposase InsO family protein
VVIREAENTARQATVMFMMDAEEAALTLNEASGMLGLCDETTREWRRRCETGQLVPSLLGRPAYDCDGWTVREIRRFAWNIGPDVSVAFICEMIDWAPRSVVEEVLARWRAEIRHDRHVEIQTLTWEKPGRVWAMDWTEPDTTIDGLYKEVLVVRDLASGKILFTLPAETRDAELVRDVLKHLFLSHGAPLVLKSDNGKELIAEVVKDLLDEYGVEPLLSPEYYPQYNGAIEAGNGSLKTHAYYAAARHGRLGHWTADDIEEGRLKANETSRPWGWRGPSPDRRWAERSAIDYDEWDLFRSTVAEERTWWVTADEEEDPRLRKTQERMAMTKALVRCGCVAIGRQKVEARRCGHA